MDGQDDLRDDADCRQHEEAVGEDSKGAVETARHLRGSAVERGLGKDKMPCCLRHEAAALHSALNAIGIRKQQGDDEAPPWHCPAGM